MNKIKILLAALALLFFAIGLFVINQPDGQNHQTTLASAPSAGKPAPDFNVKDLNGNALKLSDLQGNYVLLDFWASWCNPCRKTNPRLRSLYQHLKTATLPEGAGFEIFSFSLDTKTDKWKNAIQQDSLQWPYHACDLKGWESPVARLYYVDAIPQNFLIGPDGVIIAIDWSPEMIEQELLNP